MQTHVIMNDFTYDINAPRQEVIHHALQANVFKRFKSFGKLTATYQFQLNNRLEFDIRRGVNANRAALDMDLQTQTAAVHLLVDANSRITYELGMDASYQINTPNPDTGVRRLIPDYESIKTGAFASAVYKPSDKWVLDAGWRYDYFLIDASKFYLQSYKYILKNLRYYLFESAKSQKST